MGFLIQDVTPAYKPVAPPENVMREARRNEATHYVTNVDNDILITELHRRGVSIDQVFAQYYAEEMIADARGDELFGSDEEGQHGRQLTVGDAELAGHASLPESPVERQPF